MINKNICYTQVMTAVRAFRQGKESRGSSYLRQFIDSMTPALMENATAFTEREVMLLNEILSAQARGDLLYAADLLQYELPASSIGRLFFPEQTLPK